MFKKIASFLAIIVLVVNSYSQNLWYENVSNTQNIELTSSTNGTFSANIQNPLVTNTNTNKIVSKFTRDANVNKGFTYFKLYNPIKTASSYTISLKAYIDVLVTGFPTTPNRLRLYLKNTVNGEVFNKQLSFANSRQWQEFIFNINSSDFTQKGLSAGGYNQMYIEYGNGQYTDTKVNYYIDSIYGSTVQEPSTPTLNPNIEWMQGSWGTRLFVRGGKDLDTYVNNRGYDYVAGAQEIINKYPTIGHIITNATNNARSHLFTLRTNENLDAVLGQDNAIISEEFVPSIKNEQIIIDVINTFKNAGKKVILYLNSLDPAARSSKEAAAAWNAYVNKYFKGNAHLAWMNLCEGYVKRFAELGVDGYWLDAFSSYPGNNDEKAEFIQMFRNVDPNIVLAANFHKTYFTDGDGQYIRVDSDGINDQNKRPYRIIKLAGNDPFSDFTPGHITPLGRGAPPNSWAYEEYTIPDVQDSGTTTYNDSKLIVKHLFMPIRKTWSGDRTELVYEKEQAYRFVKKITDGGGSITFSNTTNDGTIMEDEDEILQYVNQQMLANAIPLEYTRPEGAYLVGEDPIVTPLKKSYNNLNVISKNTGIVYPSPVKDIFQISMELTSVTIFSINGTKVLEFTEKQENYDVSVLKAGFYIVEIKDSEGYTKSIYFSKE